MSKATAPAQQAILSGDRELTRAELFERAARAASGLADLGVGRDDTIAVMLRNDFPFFEASIAGSMIGAHAVPINWHFKEAEAGYILRDSEAKVLVIHSDLIPQIRSGIPEGVKTFVVEVPPEVRRAYNISETDAAYRGEFDLWVEWVNRQNPREVPAPPPPSSMIYTSGTTGNPKGVRREQYTPATAARFAELVAEVFGLKAGEPFRTVVTGPMYHSAPNAYGLWAARNGGFCVLQPRFDPEELLQLIEQHRITHVHMVPTMFVRLLKLPEATRRKYDLSSLEFVVHAAAPCSAEIKRQMIEWWGPVINEYYGGTETGAGVFHTSEEALRKPGTVGRAIAGATVRVYDSEGREAKPGEVGEVYLRIHGFPDFTYNHLPKKRAQIEHEGLFSIGDVGYLDEDGYLFLCDRKNDMVISGGVNIYPAEIEAVLIQVPGVRDCAVFGIPDDEFGESLCALIERDPGGLLTESDVRAFIGEKLADYKIPRRIEFRNDLPREDSGKIFKRLLRDGYWEKAGRKI